MWSCVSRSLPCWACSSGADRLAMANFTTRKQPAVGPALSMCGAAKWFSSPANFAASNTRSISGAGSGSGWLDASHAMARSIRAVRSSSLIRSVT